jgi:hypothetical protein
VSLILNSLNYLLNSIQENFMFEKIRLNSLFVMPTGLITVICLVGVLISSAANQSQAQTVGVIPVGSPKSIAPIVHGKEHAMDTTTKDYYMRNTQDSSVNESVKGVVALHEAFGIDLIMGSAGYSVVEKDALDGVFVDVEKYEVEIVCKTNPMEFHRSDRNVMMATVFHVKKIKVTNGAIIHSGIMVSASWLLDNDEPYIGEYHVERVERIKCGPGGADIERTYNSFLG